MAYQKIGRPKLKTPRVQRHMNLRFRTEDGLGLHQKLADAATENKRSMNAEIEHRLNESFKTKELTEIIRSVLREELSNTSPTPKGFMREANGELVSQQIVDCEMGRLYNY